MDKLLLIIVSMLIVISCFSFKLVKSESATGLYGSDGKKIRIYFNQEGQLTFSANTPKEMADLARTMAKTPTGINILKQVDASRIKIYVEVDKKRIISDDSNNIAAETYPLIAVPVNTRGKAIGAPYIAEAKIIIYEAAIRDMAIKNEGKILIDKLLIDTVQFAVPYIIASFSIHEFVHVLDKQFSGALNPTATKGEIEKKPYEIQMQYFRELKKLKNEEGNYALLDMDDNQ